MHKGNRSVDHAHAHVRFSTCRVNGLWNLDEALALAGQGAGAVHDLAPQLAGLPVAVVGRCIAKAQKNGQRQTHQRERYRRERDLDAEQIAVRDGDKGRKQDIEQQREPNSLQHRASQHKEKTKPLRPLTNDHCLEPKGNP